MIPHGFAEADGGEEVVVVVFQRHLHGFSHRLETGKMDRRTDVVLFKDAVERRAVAHVVLIEIHVLAGDLLHALDGFGAGVDQVVDDDDAVALVQKLHTGVAADVPSAAGDQYVHI